MPPPQLRDPAAVITWLTGDDWAPWLYREIGRARESVYFSLYMVSHHWRALGKGSANLLDALLKAPCTVPTCRGILGRPVASGKHETFNVKAAHALAEAGWKLREIAGTRALHEKFWLIDKRLTVVGSHNVSKASASSNYDTSLAIQSGILAEHAHRQFWQRWRDAKPLQPTEETTP